LFALKLGFWLFQMQACRDQAKIDATVNDIKAAAGQQADISGIPLELSSLKSVKDFAKAYLAKNIPLHLLILNAGIMAAPLSYTEGTSLQWLVLPSSCDNGFLFRWIRESICC
jgi:NAD(P)-dependent dehydrogenase (short-subunit alcohol dehydrogenase family)